MYLIDANVLITAKNQYYPLDRIPQFWDWLIEMGDAGEIKMPREIHDEVSQGEDPLAIWARGADTKSALILDEEPDLALVQRVLADGYQSADPRFSDISLENIQRDAFLVAYGLIANERIVVTKEVSARRSRLGKTKLPDACDDCGVPWHDDFRMHRELDFNLR